MELELEGSGGGRLVSLSTESPAADLGSGDLVTAPRADRTVSRRHVSLRLVNGGAEPRVAFEVVGRNPVVVRSSPGADKVYRRGEAGELRAGDGLSLSLKEPSFWTVRRAGVKDGEAEVDAAVLDAVARREKRTRERREKERERRAVEEAVEVAGEEEMAGAGDEELDEELEDLKLDLENIDPVQDFGFLSMGHEFDKYPKGRIRLPKDWNWFLEETKKSSDDEDDDDVSNTGRKSRGGGGVNRKKMKKKGEDEDEEWTDESEDEKDSLQAGPSVKRPKKYVTRSKDAKKPRKESSRTENEGAADEDDETEEEDEQDETLGGFIIKEEDEPMEELSEEVDEEEEFDDEDEDD